MDSAREANIEPPCTVNLDQELMYWRDHYLGSPFYRSGMDFDDYGPALKLGIHAFLKSRGRSYDELTSHLGEAYERTRGASRLEWPEGCVATAAAWQRMSIRYPAADGSRPVPSASASRQSGDYLGHAVSG